MRETLNILFEGTPRGMKLERIESAIRRIEGINDVPICTCGASDRRAHALSCHISIADIPPSISERILRDVKECLLHDPYRPHQFSLSTSSARWRMDA